MAAIVEEYDAKQDTKKRITIRGAYKRIKLSELPAENSGSSQ